MLFQAAVLWCTYIWTIEAVVLDPALYMVPSPPLSDGKDSVPATEMWSRKADVRNDQDIRLEDTQTMSTDVNTIPRIVEAERPARKRSPPPVEKAKLFWPRSQPTQYSLGTIQVPLTFGLSGSYGKYTGNVGMGIVGSTYGTVANIGGAAVSGLAGSSYGTYRAVPSMRIYGRESDVAWSGWGNGKWGQYGKG